MHLSFGETVTRVKKCDVFKGAKVGAQIDSIGADLGATMLIEVEIQIMIGPFFGPFFGSFSTNYFFSVRSHTLVGSHATLVGSTLEYWPWAASFL